MYKWVYDDLLLRAFYRNWMNGWWVVWDGVRSGMKGTLCFILHIVAAVAAT